MERVKGNADRQQDVEVRWMIDDADARYQPLEIFEQEVSVFEKPEHAEIHADTANQPYAPRMAWFGPGNSSPEPEIHRRRGKEERGKRWVPRAVKNITRSYKQIFSRDPRMDAPVRGHDHYEKDNEGERIEKHAIAYLRTQDNYRYFIVRFVRADGKQEVYW